MKDILGPKRMVTIAWGEVCNVQVRFTDRISFWVKQCYPSSCALLCIIVERKTSQGLEFWHPLGVIVVGELSRGMVGVRRSPSSPAERLRTLS